MWIELSLEEAKLISEMAGLTWFTLSDSRYKLHRRFAAIVAAGDEPRILDTEGNVVSSRRLTYYGDENDILEIAGQRDKKLTPKQLDEVAKSVDDCLDWTTRVEDALDEEEKDLVEAQ